jgi:hypothetical protein
MRIRIEPLAAWRSLDTLQRICAILLAAAVLLAASDYRCRLAMRMAAHYRLYETKAKLVKLCGTLGLRDAEGAKRLERRYKRAATRFGD